MKFNKRQMEVSQNLSRKMWIQEWAGTGPDNIYGKTNVYDTELFIPVMTHLNNIIGELVL